MSTVTGLQALLDRGLPLNRKETFFTATILPMIVCRERFSHFSRFVSLIPGAPTVDFDGSPTSTNIEFFTEYSFVESVRELSRSRFVDIPVSKQKPDVVALVTGTQPFLLAVEAKMYNATTKASLAKQMTEQRPMLECIAQGLGIESVVHVALLPEKLRSRIEPFAFPIITWEQICDEFEPVVGDDYFIAMLRSALNSYDELAAVPTQFGLNCEQYVSGQEIYDAFKSGDIAWTMMGRKWGGIRGKPLKDDIATGDWRDWPYEVHSRKAPSTGNWFPIADWVAVLDRALERSR